MLYPQPLRSPSLLHWDVWALIASDDGEEPETAQGEITLPEPDTQVSDSTPEVPAEPETPPTETAERKPETPAADEPELSPTDTAILEALNVEPTLVEEVDRDPEPQDIPAQPDIEITTPTPLPPPAPAPQDELYLASIDKSNLSKDAIAQPSVESFATDTPFDQVALPSVAGSRFDLDESGLVIPSTEGALNPEGIVVFLGRPSKAPRPLQSGSSRNQAWKNPRQVGWIASQTASRRPD